MKSSLIKHNNPKSLYVSDVWLEKGKQSSKLHQIKMKQMSEQQNKMNKQIPKQQKQKHQGYKYIYGSNSLPNQILQKYIKDLYNGLFYSLKALKGPSKDYIIKKSIKLKRRLRLQKNNKQQYRKILFLDLDQTLIHTIRKQQQSSDITLHFKKQLLRFNIRPYCEQLLQHLNSYYDIYIFTAANIQYAEVIIQYLNSKKQIIMGILNRKNCMKTSNNFLIKDLRIVQNAQLKQIIIVDNSVHSFGLQINNGIPILPFTNDKNDRELKGLQSILLQMKDVKDVCQYLSTKLQLTQLAYKLENWQTNFRSNSEKKEET